jgi:hypothetical protein
MPLASRVSWRELGRKAEQPLAAFGWSSYPRYLAAPSRRPSWLRVNPFLQSMPSRTGSIHEQRRETGLEKVLVGSERL